VKKAVIIGAGVGGLATSIRLATKGYECHVFEMAQGPGGKLSEFLGKGYRFDFGPSLFTLPTLVDELFEVAGEDPRDHFQYEKLEESCRYFYEDGTRLTTFADHNKLGKEIEQKLGVKADVVKKHLKRSKMIYDATKPVFLEKSLHKAADLFNRDTLKALSMGHKFDLMKTMHKSNVQRLKEPRLVQLFDRYATYNGSNPYRAPGILNLIPALEHVDGAYFPKGGMFAISRNLAALAERKGVRFHFNTSVDEILHNQEAATGVKIGQKSLEADVVVSNMDAYLTYRKLLPGFDAPEKTLNQERSSSALVFYWGIKKKFDELGLHNIFFSSDYEDEFRHIFSKKTISSDPTVYVNITSKLHPPDAPDGHENWFTMVNAPSVNGQDWDELVQSVRKQVIAKVSRNLGTDIEDLIDYEFITDPPLIESKTMSHLGSLYGTSSNSRMAAFLRHPNFNQKLKNLFFVGGSVHPGGGIPLCLMSAKIIESLL
jgi:diapolycopene oxygenase